MKARNVVAGEWIVGAVGDARVEALECAAEMTLRIVQPALAKIYRANLDVQFEQRAIAEGMITGTDKGHFSLVLPKRLDVLALQVVNVAQPCVRADDLQPEVARDVLLL